MNTLKMNGGKGELQQVIVGGVYVSKYVGEFENKNLQIKAELGLWYTRIPGNPHAMCGEGSTPELAIRDSIRRTSSRIAEMQRGLQALERAVS
jgi:hypothetical protein